MKLKIFATTILAIIIAIIIYIIMGGPETFIDKEILKEKQIVLQSQDIAEFPPTDGYVPNRELEIKGKILIWEKNSSIPSKLNNKIPKGLRANSSDKEITIFLIKNDENYTRTAIIYYPSMTSAKGYIFPITNEYDKKSNPELILLYIYYAIGKSKDPSVVENLIDALQYNNTEVTNYVIIALGMIGNERSIEILTKIKNDQNQSLEIRNNAKSIIDNVEMLKKVDKLISDLYNEDANIRANAARELGKIGDKRAVDPLIQTLNDGIPNVRANAAEALGEIGDIRAIAQLTWVKNIDEEDENVKNVAELAIQKIKEKNSIEYQEYYQIK